MAKNRSQGDSDLTTRVTRFLSYQRSRDVARPGREFGPDEPGCFVRIRDDDECQTYFNKLTMDYTPLMTMNHIDGFKYTVGNKFVSRRSQGEFVYLNLKDRPPSLSDEENYFALECRDGGIWLTRSQEGFRSSTVVSVNGMPLGSDNNVKGAEPVDPSIAERKLVFREIVTISLGDNGEGDKKKGFADFIFKAKRESTQRSVGTELASSSNATLQENKVVDVDDNLRVLGPMDNPLFVQNIVGFLPTKNLKKMRLVSHLWNIECLKTLRPRVIVTALDHMAWIDVSDYVYSHLNELKFPHWKIKLTKKCWSDHGTNVWEKKVLDDLTWLLDPELHKQNVKSLLLSSHFRSETSSKIFEVVLRGVKNSLTTLNLKMDFNDKFSPPSLAEMEIPGLQFLSISMDRKPPSPSLLKSFIESILPAVHNIQTLTLSDPSSDTAVAICFSSLVVEGIAKIQSVGPQGFANLTSIVIDSEGISWHQIEPLSFLRQGSLKKLQVGEIMPRTLAAGETLPVFSALERHSNTLEELTLIFNLKSETSLTIPFPQAMKNLKNLSVYFILEGEWKWSTNRTLRFLFGRGEGGDPNSDGSVDKINYRRHLPSLTNLEVFPVRRSDYLPDGDGLSKWGRAYATWRAFLPIAAGFLQSVTDDNGRVVPAQSIENVNIPFLLDGKYHNVLDNLEINFPNAVFPAALATARRSRSPVWTEENEALVPVWIPRN